MYLANRPGIDLVFSGNVGDSATGWWLLLLLLLLLVMLILELSRAFSFQLEAELESFFTVFCC
jgi:hypothetical protein